MSQKWLLCADNIVLLFFVTLIPNIRDGIQLGELPIIIFNLTSCYLHGKRISTRHVLKESIILFISLLLGTTISVFFCKTDIISCILGVFGMIFALFIGYGAQKRRKKYE